MNSRNRYRSQAELVGILVGGEWVVRPPAIELRNPFDGCLAGAVSTGGTADVQSAITRAVAALATDLPAHARWRLLSKTAECVEAQAEDYV
jgi:acyl-CoA reductase-like NAD-dependent aldehyde dehydrogenase